MTLKTKPFEFTNEFTPTGEFLSGDKPSFKRTETVEQETAQARAEGEAAAMATIEARIATALEQILAQLTPVEQVVTEIASDLRNDAIDLALAASRTIAGKALEEFWCRHGARSHHPGCQPVAGRPRDPDHCSP